MALRTREDIDDGDSAIEAVSEPNEDASSSTSSIAAKYLVPIDAVCMAASHDSFVIVTAQQQQQQLSSRLCISNSLTANHTPTSPSSSFLTLPYPVHSVACGANHALALAHDGRLMLSWGSNDYGQLGIGDGDGERASSFVAKPTPILASDAG